MTKDQDYFAELPNEMVMKILSFLDYDTMLSARLCCIRFDSILTGFFEQSSQFKLDGLKNFKLSRNNLEHNWVFKTNKKFKNLCFFGFNFDDANNADIDEFWDMHGKNVINFDLRFCSAAEKTLNKILDMTVNLKRFMCGLSRDIDGGKIINKLYDRCVEITFTSTTFIDKNEIDMISTDRKTAIEELSLTSVRCGSHGDTPFRESGIYKLLNLKRFELLPTNADTKILKRLLQLNLNLEKFKIDLGNEIIDKCSMLTMTNQMKNLQKLDITGTLFNDKNANMIYDNLHELRSLTFSKSIKLTNYGIINVTKLKKLEEFNTTGCEKITSWYS